MSLNIVSLGRRIRLTRKKRGLSQNVLSEMIDKTPAFLSYIEGGSKCMSLDTFVDLVNALNTTADDLLRDSLNNTVIIIHNSFSELLSDCTQYEERVLLDTVIAVKETLRSNWFYSAADRQLAAENMARMGIADLADKSCRQLSGGQLQRVLLARALCAADQALVLDEPVTGLDPQVTADLYRLIEELNRAGVTIIMISHDLGAALKYATHILSFSDRIFFGTRQEFTALMGQEAQA